MKKVVLVLGLLMTSSIVLTSCREEKSGIEQAADDVEDAAEDVGDDIEDIGDDM